MPSDEQGPWVIDYFRPGLHFLFPQNSPIPTPPSPANCATMPPSRGKETGCPKCGAVSAWRETIFPRSRTFFSGTLADNPHYDENVSRRAPIHAGTGTLVLLCGNFAAEATADPWQVIPTRVGQTGATTLD